MLYQLSKRLFDFIFAVIGLVFLSPLFILIAVGIKVSSPGPVLYRQERVGRFGIKFILYKFRTMIDGSELLGRETTGLNDFRITAFGLFLRQNKLDEIPQLLNVIRGEMSLVGPRPEISFYVDKYSEDDKVVLSVRPGITDSCSLALSNLEEVMQARGDATPQEFYENQILPYKLILQKDYILRASFIVDIMLIFRTIFKVFSRK
jgi:lipopolysaccharide/colanic/teichoic acid biosynthesis glycosyltransferase